MSATPQPAVAHATHPHTAIILYCIHRWSYGPCTRPYQRVQRAVITAVHGGNAKPTTFRPWRPGRPARRRCRNLRRMHDFPRPPPPPPELAAPTHGTRYSRGQLLSIILYILQFYTNRIPAPGRKKVRGKMSGEQKVRGQKVLQTEKMSGDQKAWNWKVLTSCCSHSSTDPSELQGPNNQL